MFRTFARKFLPNPLDWRLKRFPHAREVLVCWNRGLGDIALGIYAIVHRIRHFLPGARITCLVRGNLADGFSMLDGITVLRAPRWKRGEPIDVAKTLCELGLNIDAFDLVLQNPSPSDWCRWQYGAITPRLRWDPAHDALWRKFNLPDGFTYIGVQVTAETNYGLWRNWPLAHWEKLFDLLGAIGGVRVILFGFGTTPAFTHPMVIDLRAQTTLFELLSVIKGRCSHLIVPDSGVLSMAYYLDATFPLRVISLWADPKHGILKQGVASPNPELVHVPLVGAHRDLATVSPEQVMEAVFFPRQWTPLRRCLEVEHVTPVPLERTACVILAGGQGSRLGVSGPKGLFSVLGKTLFQHLVEKVPVTMPLAIMTSEDNDEETRRYFSNQGLFGRRIDFFCQTSLPLLDEQYREVGRGPDGNGSLYQGLMASGLVQQWLSQGIDTLLVLPIENPLADPADARLVAHHRNTQADVTIKCVERISGESMGLLVEEEGHLRIAEYIELKSPVEGPAYSYVGQMALSLEFVQRAASLTLPLHWVKKRGVWKRERFLFDAFGIAERSEALCYPRAMCYAPIKNQQSLENAERALEQLWTAK